MARVLVVDDEETICWGLSKLVRGMGHEVASAASAVSALEAAGARRPDCVVLDVRLPGMDGLAAMERLRAVAGATAIIVMTAYGDLETAVEAVRQGAFEYLVKPFDLEVAERVIGRALEAEGAGKTRAESERGAAAEVGGLWGKSREMQEVFKRIALVAPSEACVLLGGESGTGKELAARAIHFYSRRAGGPFVAVHVAALASSLVESELFGHVRGAFTGATQSRRGLLEQADGGTVFLDEVAEIPLAVQVKLLRALELGEFCPVGAEEPRHSDFRVISATHRELGEMASRGEFRQDLLYRLGTFRIAMPALRERREDIAELVGYFLEVLAEKNGGERRTVSAEAMEELVARSWYGNVRELRNAVEHAYILARGGRIGPEHLPAASGGSAASPERALVAAARSWAEAELRESGGEGKLHEQLLSLVEPAVLTAVIERHGGRRGAAARRLGLHRITLRKKLEEYGMSG